MGWTHLGYMLTKRSGPHVHSDGLDELCGCELDTHLMAFYNIKIYTKKFVIAFCWVV